MHREELIFPFCKNVVFLYLSKRTVYITKGRLFLIVIIHEQEFPGEKSGRSTCYVL